jgi:acetoin utilization protein AcuB
MIVKTALSRQVITVRPEANLVKARALMAAYCIRHLPVVDADDRLVGIITDRDIRSATPCGLDRGDPAGGQDVNGAEMLVGEVMSSPPHTISADYTLQDVMIRFQETKVGAFPVVDPEQRVVGIISERDLLQAFIQVMGVHQPGVFVGIELGNTPEDIGKLVRAVAGAGISVGSLLTRRDPERGRCTVFAYLHTQNISRVKRLLKAMAFTWVNPMEWLLEQLDT